MGPVTSASCSPKNMLISVRTPKESTVNPWFDGKSGAGQQPPVVVGLVVVHVHAIAMHVAPEIMTGSMQNPFPESGLLQNVPRRAIDLPSSQVARWFWRRPAPGRPPHPAPAEWPRTLSLISARDPAAGERHPGNIGIDRLRVVALFPHRSSSTSSPAPIGRGARGRHVVRIPRVLLRRDHRFRIADEPFFLEPLDHLLLNRQLRSIALAVAHALGDQRERAILYPIERLPTASRCVASA